MRIVPFLLAALTAPSPQPALKTIVTVHSSPFCTALTNSVKPALVGLMRNDQLIDVGRSALTAGDHDVNQGGTATSSYNQQGSAAWSMSAGDEERLNARQREIASALEHNIETIDKILGNLKQLAPGDEQATLAAIKSQLSAILDKQRTAVNILAGTADSADLASLYNSGVYNGIAEKTIDGTMDSLGSASPLTSRLATQHNVVSGAGSTTDPTTTIQVQVANAEASKPLSNPYAKIARAMQADQILIGQSEDAAATTIVTAASGCK